MKDITLVLLAAGNSTRFQNKTKKQWLYIDNTPLWLMVVNEFKRYNFANIIVVSSFDEIQYMNKFADSAFVVGGKTRQESLKNAIKEINTKYTVVTDVARCCVDHSMVSRILDARAEADCIVPAISLSDTLYTNNKPSDREESLLIQTPQLSVTHLLKDALNSKITFTDDSSAMFAIGATIKFVEGSKNAHKLTTPEDIDKIPCLKKPSQKVLIGFGLDTHVFKDGKKMVLGGVHIDSDVGLKAHSDGDAAIHAIIDALLGAAGMGDIGEYFPDTDNAYKGADSRELLKYVAQKIYAFGFEINNIDITIVAQKPKITPHKLEMRKTLANLMEINPQFVNIKATTSENVGFIGRSEGLTVHAIASLSYRNWSKN